MDAVGGVAVFACVFAIILFVVGALCYVFIKKVL